MCCASFRISSGRAHAALHLLPWEQHLVVLVVFPISGFLQFSLFPILLLFLYQGGFLLFFNFGKLFSFYKISFHLPLPLCFSSVFLALPKKVSIAISLVDCFLAASFNKCPRRSSSSFVFRLDAQEICTN